MCCFFLMILKTLEKTCIYNYTLDPLWYYTSPSLSWDACLKYTEVKLELLTD